MDQPAVEEAPLAPLMGLVDRLREEGADLQEEWEALGVELEAKRCALSLAESTLEELQKTASCEGGSASQEPPGAEGASDGELVMTASVTAAQASDNSGQGRCSVVRLSRIRRFLAVASVPARQQRPRGAA
jgi:hypothetical protein